MSVSKKNRKMKIDPPRPSARVKRRHSPGGKIICANSHLVSRRRYNMALRLQMIPTCNECGSDDLQIQGVHEIRVNGLTRRLIFQKRGGRLRKRR